MPELYVPETVYCIDRLNSVCVYTVYYTGSTADTVKSAVCSVTVNSDQGRTLAPLWDWTTVVSGYSLHYTPDTGSQGPEASFPFIGGRGLTIKALGTHEAEKSEGIT